MFGPIRSSIRDMLDAFMLVWKSLLNLISTKRENHFPFHLATNYIFAQILRTLRAQVISHRRRACVTCVYVSMQLNRERRIGSGRRIERKDAKRNRFYGFRLFTDIQIGIGNGDGVCARVTICLTAVRVHIIIVIIIIDPCWEMVDAKAFDWRRSQRNRGVLCSATIMISMPCYKYIFYMCAYCVCTKFRLRLMHTIVCVCVCGVVCTDDSYSHVNFYLNEMRHEWLLCTGHFICEMFVMSCECVFIFLFASPTASHKVHTSILIHMYICHLPETLLWMATEMCSSRAMCEIVKSATMLIGNPYLVLYKIFECAMPVQYNPSIRPAIIYALLCVCVCFCRWTFRIYIL